MPLCISVIIPGHNRAALIPRLFASYRAQTLARDRFDVHFIDDHSTDGTCDAVQKEIETGGIDLHLHENPGKGPAAARNRGLDASSGEIVYFSGDDFLPEPENLAHHLAFHETPGECRALIGLTTSPEEWRRDRFFRWLGTRGLIYDERVYFEIRDPGKCHWNYFHTNNLSLSREWLIADRFDESYEEPCMEDTELGFRLMKKGLVIAHDPGARGLHIHEYNWDSLIRSMQRIGRMAVKMLRQHPDYAREALLFERTHIPSVRETLRDSWRQIRGRWFPWESIWAYRAGQAYIRGFHRAAPDPDERLRLLKLTGG